MMQLANNQQSTGPNSVQQAKSVGKDFQRKYQEELEEAASKDLDTSGCLVHYESRERIMTEFGYEVTPLIQAIQSADIKKASEIINSCTDINVPILFQEKPYKYPIHISSKEGLVEILKLLLEKGADVNSKGFANSVPLDYAKDLETAKVLTDAGADVNSQNGLGYTPLHTAMNVQITQLLISLGADINVESIHGTALITARDAKIAQALLNAGANPEAKDQVGSTARKNFCSGWGGKEFQSLSICQQEQKDVSAAGEINLAEDGN